MHQTGTTCLFLVTICTACMLVSAAPLYTGQTQSVTPGTEVQNENTESQTGSPALLSLILSGNQVSLEPEETTERATTHAVTISTVTRASFTESTAKGSSIVSLASVDPIAAEPQHRGIRSAATEETTGRSETTAIPSTEAPLNQQSLSDAYNTVLTLAAKVDKQHEEILALNGASHQTFREDVAYATRPRLSAHIIPYAKDCVQTQVVLKEVHRVVNDYISFVKGLTTLTGDTTVATCLRSLNFHLSNLIEPSYEYYPTAAPGTHRKDTIEVIYTLIALQYQSGVTQDVLQDLIAC